MSLIDLGAFDAATLQHDPFDFLVVPGFLKLEALAAVNKYGERLYEAELYRLKGELSLKDERRTLRVNHRRKLVFLRQLRWLVLSRRSRWS